MRIALVYPHFNLTGSHPRIQVQLARYLVEAGHDVHAYSFAPTRDSELAPGIRFHDVRATPVSGSRIGLALHVASFARNATRMIERDRGAYDVVYGLAMSTWEQDVIHIGGVLQGEIRRERLSRDSPPGAARRVKDALLSVSHPIVPVRAFIERRIYEDRLPFEIHVDSRLTRDDLRTAYDIDPGRIRIVHPGVNLHEFGPPADRTAARREVGVARPEPVILFCGADFPRKGLDRALLALGKMREPAQLLVVGGGDPAFYDGLARRLGVIERVRFLGPRTDTWRFFQAADIFVLPTHVDMWGMTIVEAMATAIPAITTTGAGAAEAIVHNENGFVLPEPLDVDLLGKTLDRLAADPELRLRIGQQARKSVLTLTAEHFGRQTETALKEVAERRKRLTAARTKPSLSR